MKLVTSKKQGGFTLVELVMVIVVIALLSAYVGPKFASLEGQTRAATLNKIAGTLAETINVVKAISITELDGNVPDAQAALITAGNSLTAIDYDGRNATSNAADDVAAIIIVGEDILTEFHYPKAISSDATTLAEAGSAAATDTSDTADSILFALKGTNVQILRMYDVDADTTVLEHKTSCADDTQIDNNGSLGGVHSKVIAYATTGASGAADQVLIVPCGILASSDYNTVAAEGMALSAIGCSVLYKDAGLSAATALLDDIFAEPSVTVATNGC